MATRRSPSDGRPRDGTVIVAALLLGPVIGTVLLVLPFSLYLSVLSLVEPNAPDGVLDLLIGATGFVGLSVVFGFLLGSVPAVVGGLLYAALRRGLGENAGTAAFCALAVALPIALWLGLSGGGPGGFAVVVTHFVLTGLVTWGVATARWRRRA